MLCLVNRRATVLCCVVLSHLTVLLSFIFLSLEDLKLFVCVCV